MSLYQPMQVQRLDGERGSSEIRPPLEPSWQALDKLRWKMGVILVDTGVPLTISYATRDHRRFCLGGPGWGFSDQGFVDAWNFLTGFELGAEQANKIQKEQS